MNKFNPNELIKLGNTYCLLNLLVKFWKPWQNPNKNNTIIYKKREEMINLNKSIDFRIFLETDLFQYVFKSGQKHLATQLGPSFYTTF